MGYGDGMAFAMNGHAMPLHTMRSLPLAMATALRSIPQHASEVCALPTMSLSGSRHCMLLHVSGGFFVSGCGIDVPPGTVCRRTTHTTHDIA
ncbi:hypothetical protein [Noviherbaspirillum cavernae]|uniref:hypothetical protein n=1 Tax=Noviherbaspirillum cavernae TaxID=2320862 RepID=UPI001314C0D4|nr:hypothetical protein [Noviherbaspirillum cavernae]